MNFTLYPSLPPPQEIDTSLVAARALPGEGRVLLVHLVRTGGGNDLAHKVATPVAEPQPNEPSWPDKELVMVVAHQSVLGRSGGGHFISFFRVQGIWWRVDTQARDVVRENPFQGQMASNRRDGYTINFLVFT